MNILWQYDRTTEVTLNYTPNYLIKETFGIERQYRAIVWHSIEGSLESAIRWWNEQRAQSSAHLAIAKNGDIHLIVKLEDVAWHAGTNNYTGRSNFWKQNNINSYSIGVELEGSAETGFTPQQAQSVKKLSAWFAQPPYSINPAHTFDQIDGHHAHSEISNQRSDPGPHFNWGWIMPDTIDAQKIINALDRVWNVRQVLDEGSVGITNQLRRFAAELKDLQHENYSEALTSIANLLNVSSDMLFLSTVDIKEATGLQ